MTARSTTVVDNEHLFIERDEAKRRVIVRRTDSKFAIEDVDTIFAPALAALGAIDGWSLLLDMRRAPPRVDDKFEAAMNKHLEPLMIRFRRRAILVRSAVGVLQVNRVSRRMGGDNDDTGIFRDDEAAALAFLG